jgi:UDP-N-acetylmuramoyl-tripeptide--D-alanyl-D-alanine ligase
MNLTLSDCLKISHLAVIDVTGHEKQNFTGVSIDSRTIEQGNLFLAIRGEKFDGHNFVTAAIRTGAAAVIVDRQWVENNAALMASLAVPRLVVENTTVALGALARVYRRKFRIPVLAIGGSNGKTTTKEMIHAVLGKKYRVLSTQGNLNNHIGVPQTLFRLVRSHRAAVIEMGTNHAGEIRALCQIAEPTHALITNIGREHLEFFGSVAGVVKAETELFDWLKERRKRKAIVFVNKDNGQLVKKAKGLKSLSYGLKAPADVRGTVMGFDQKGRAKLRIRSKGKSGFDVQLSVPGHHNVVNALAAATIGLAFRVPTKKIQSALQSFSTPGKRMEELNISGFTVFNDTYNSNPDSVLAALQTMKSFAAKGKRIAVLADMLELGASAEKEHKYIGSIVSRYGVEYLLTYGELSRFTSAESRTKFKAHYEQKNMLAEYLAELLTPGDVVLIKGSRAMKMEDIVTFLKERFSRAA